MTPDRPENDPFDEESENSVLADTGSIDTSHIGLLGGTTEQVSVSFGAPSDEDDLDDDDVVGDEVPFDAEFPTITAEAEIVDDLDEDWTTAAPTGETYLASEPIGASAYARAAGIDGAEEDVVADTVDVQEHDWTRIPDAESPASEAVPTSAPESGLAPTAAPASGPVPTMPASAPVSTAPVAASATTEPGPAPAPAPVPLATTTSVPVTPAAATPSGSIPTSTAPATRRAAQHPAEPERADRTHAVERVHTRTDVTLTSKRLGEFEGGRESADLLTADRLLDPHQVVKPEPEGAWQHFLYSISGHRINLGDGKRARARKELDRRIAAPLHGGARFVPVLSRKGGVGKTTITTLLGMALAGARDDRIIAIDANPDRGTLAERIARVSGKTVRDLVRARGEVVGFNDLSGIVARDETRLDILASDTDPRVSEAFSDRDYHDVASLAAHYYSIVLTDTGTGIVHSVMEATLDLADQIVIVSGLSIDEARLASETLTWLETNGYSEQVRNAVVVLNNARPGTPIVRETELETHFRSRVRQVVRVPYDAHIAAGSAIAYRDLQPATRQAARELAAAVVEGLRTLAPAA